MLINYLESELNGVELFSRLRNENLRHARAINRDDMFAIAEMLRRKIRPASLRGAAIRQHPRVE